MPMASQIVGKKAADNQKACWHGHLRAGADGLRVGRWLGIGIIAGIFPGFYWQGLVGQCRFKRGKALFHIIANGGKTGFGITAGIIILAVIGGWWCWRGHLVLQGRKCRLLALPVGGKLAFKRGKPVSKNRICNIRRLTSIALANRH